MADGIFLRENCYQTALRSGVLPPHVLEPVKKELSGIRPFPAVFDRRYVRKLDGKNVKKAANKMALAEAVIRDIETISKEKQAEARRNGVVRLNGSLHGAKKGPSIH